MPKIKPIAILLSWTWSLTAAFPTFLVNSCERQLQVGEVIMGFPVAASTSAPPAQNHAIRVVNADGLEVCDFAAAAMTVTQGESLTIEIENSLASAVLADGWTPGQGPNYIVEATNAIIMTETEIETGCDSTRAVNPAGRTTLLPLQAGTMVVRLLSAYAFGQVYASQECSITVEGTQTVVQHTGYLVDNASWAANSTVLSMMPYELSVEQLRSGADSGFSILAQETPTDDSYSIRYALEPSADLTDYLDSLPSNMTNVQVAITGFLTGDAETSASVSLISVAGCTSAATCTNFMSIPTDQVCVSDGLCIESSSVNEDEGTLTATFVSNDASWFGIGFSTPGGGMTAGGAGSDMFVCSAEGLRRFLVTAQSNPGTSAVVSETLAQSDPDDEVILNFCELDTATNTGRMTFTRPLADTPRTILQNQPQALIWARGPNEQSLSTRHDRRGEVSLDLTNLGSGVAVTRREAPWILWCHIVCMSLSWGLFLPLAVVIANRTRNVTGGKHGSWYRWHKSLARVGWFLQTLGALFAIYYCEVYANHMQFVHSKLGAFVVLAGFFQPISAVIRPHHPKNGWPNGKPPLLRTIFEVYHKGLGWTAAICGLVNVFLGVRLVKDLDFEDMVLHVPFGLGSIGVLLSTGLFVLSLINKDNIVSRLLTGATTQASTRE